MQALTANLSTNLISFQARKKAVSQSVSHERSNRYTIRNDFDTNQSTGETSVQIRYTIYWLSACGLNFKFLTVFNVDRPFAF